MSLILYTPEYLKDEKDDKKDDEVFVGNQNELYLEIINIEKFKG